MSYFDLAVSLARAQAVCLRPCELCGELLPDVEAGLCSWCQYRVKHGRCAPSLFDADLDRQLEREKNRCPRD